MHRLFETQELVTAICGSLYLAYDLKPDASHGYWWDMFKSTGLVSTCFFHGMLPYIWESVKIRDLFKRGLIPAELTETRNRTRVHISESISLQTMTRFRFYAPYIKVLRVPIRSYYAADIDNWEPLVTYSKNNELLPNLVELECEEFDLQAISVFSSGSTQQITIKGPPRADSDGSDLDDSDEPEVPRKGLDITGTRQFLEHAAYKCPNLRSLEFHPESNEIIDAPRSLQTFTFLSNFRHLRRLVSSPVVLQSAALQLIAQLPSLNTLSIRPNERGGHWNSSLCEQVPTGSFPALGDLTLGLRTPRDAGRFWELIPLHTLKHLDLTITSRSRQDASEFIPALCRTSPLIAALKLKVGGWSFSITADMFEHLARLPIESFSFLDIRLDFEGAWAKVAGAWPNLKSLKCTESANLDDLLFLSLNLPKLENIDCHFDLQGAADTVEKDWMPAGRPPFYPNLKYLSPLSSNLTRLYDHSALRGLARFVAYFWPKLSIKYIKEDNWEEYADDDEKDLRRMNQDVLAGQEAVFVVFQELIFAYVHFFHPDLIDTSHNV
ncbi:hypothetical protein FS749_011419 [Ceratobasidium sp. UAMH 11750]|nr:hypothetical protein FS749_011419 [Ceratobasidium sp. UAMH 11750]